MLMPKTAVNKDDEAMLRQHDVGAPRQIATMKSETQANPVGGTTDD
jgi:hypothetical protein